MPSLSRDAATDIEASAAVPLRRTLKVGVAVALRMFLYGERAHPRELSHLSLPQHANRRGMSSRTITKSLAYLESVEVKSARSRDYELSFGLLA